MLFKNKLLKIVSDLAGRFPYSNILILFGAVIVGLLLVFAPSGRGWFREDLPIVIYGLMAVTLLLIIGAGFGIHRFKAKSQVSEGLSVIVEK